STMSSATISSQQDEAYFGGKIITTDYAPCNTINNQQSLQRNSAEQISNDGIEQYRDIK
ncbi:unnamed protein product, partial [Ceratitis capitata]